MKQVFLSCWVILLGSILQAQTITVRLDNINPKGWPFINDICYDADSTIWSGDSNAELFSRKKNETQFTKITTPNINNEEIEALLVNTPNDIWMAVSDKGIYHYDGTTWNVHDVSKGLPANSDWRRIIKDNNGHIWFANNGDGIARFNGTSWRYFTTGNSGLKSNFIDDMAVNSDGRIWAGSDEWLMIFNGSSWSSRDLDKDFGFKTWINSFHLDATGRMWITTDSGILVNENNQLVSKKNQYGSLDISCVAVDKKGVVWFVETFEGVHRYANGKDSLLTPDDDPLFPTQAWEILVTAENEKLMIGNRGANLIRINDDAVISSSKETGLSAGFSITPNPVTDMLFLKTTATFNSFHIVDLSGRKMPVNIVEKTPDGYQLQLDFIRSGVGLVILEGITVNGDVYQSKFVK